MKFTVWMLGCLVVASTCVAVDLTGTIVPPFPDKWKEQGAHCIAGGTGVKNTCDYIVGVVEKDQQLVLYFGKSAPRKDPNKALWLVTDQMPYPETGAGFQVVYGLCEKNGKPDPGIIAVVKSTDSEWYEIIESAYQANVYTGQFAKTTTQGLRCGNEGWGL